MERCNSTSVLDCSVRRKGSKDSVERICDLPDSILGHILSFLPTEKAFATHILSQRWKFLWTKTTNLDFHNNKYSFERNSHQGFVKFVNYVLLVHKARYLNRFSLIWKNESIPFQVNTWLSIALARNMHELCVHASTCPLQIQVLRSVFSCQGLRSLELNCEICISPEFVVSLPRLESLKLASIYFQTKEDCRKLCSGCPVLKYLYIDMDIARMVRGLGVDINDGVVFEYEVSSTILRHFEIYARGSFPDVQHTRCSVHLDAPSLEYVKIHDKISTIFILRTCTSLVEADIQLAHASKSEDQNYCNSMVEPICAFGYAKTLTLSAQVTRALSSATTKMSTMFNKLTRLDLKIDPRHWSSVQDFIELLDHLEVLTIQKDYITISEEGNFNNKNWKSPEAIPRCLSYSLKTVSLKSYDGFWDELEMIGYILKHGCVLEVLEISFGANIDISFISKFNALQKILKFPRKSPVCEVELREEPVYFGMR